MWALASSSLSLIREFLGEELVLAEYRKARLMALFKCAKYEQTNSTCSMLPRSINQSAELRVEHALSTPTVRLLADIRKLALSLVLRRTRAQRLCKLAQRRQSLQAN
jgi:hypothetical protein